MKATELKKLIEDSGMTRDAVARYLGVGNRTIYEWLTSGVPKPLTADSVRRRMREAKHQNNERIASRACAGYLKRGDVK